MEHSKIDKLLQDDVKKYSLNTGKPVESESFDNLMSSLQDEKIKSIRASIKEIEAMVEGRKALSRDLVNTIDSISTNINNMLLKLSISEDNPEHLKVLQKLVDIEELKVAEKLNCWRDVAQLKKEMREHQKEMREQESNINILDSILGK